MSDKSKETGRWERTGTQNLLRERQTGRFYGRWKVGRKQIWRSLDTDVLGVAKLRLGAELAKIEARRGAAQAVAAGDARMSDLISAYRERTLAHSELKESSKTARLVALKKLLKTWPGIERMQPKSVTPSGVQDWAARFKMHGTRFKPNGATKVIAGNSATSVNRAIDTLRRLLDIAVERGQIASNPVNVKPGEGRLKKKVTVSRLVLPGRADVDRVLAAIEHNGAVGGWGAEAADLCRFMLFSGARIGEVPSVTWGHVNLERNEMRIPGYKSQTSDRMIPLFPALKTLLQKITHRREKASTYGAPMPEKSDPIIRLKECQKSLDRACESCGVQRVTHHDFRHLFATTCIESGVDIPTVSRWLGHSDGGALAMKTYGHLRSDHSQAAAARVNFG